MASAAASGPGPHAAAKAPPVGVGGEDAAAPRHLAFYSSIPSLLPQVLHPSFPFTPFSRRCWRCGRNRCPSWHGRRCSWRPCERGCPCRPGRRCPCWPGRWLACGRAQYQRRCHRLCLSCHVPAPRRAPGLVGSLPSAIGSNTPAAAAGPSSRRRHHHGRHRRGRWRGRPRRRQSWV
jgi:hypothetical protein